MKDLKYLVAYTIPLVASIGIQHQGFLSFLTPLYVFLIIPILELIFPVDSTNISDAESETLKNKKGFDWLLYLNLPLVYGLLVFALITITTNDLETYEFVGLIASVGIVLGGNGINVGHELGHRQATIERFI